MKTQFFVGMGLGAAAAASVAMLMTPKSKDVKKALGTAKQTLDQAVRKFG